MSVLGNLAVHDGTSYLTLGAPRQSAVMAALIIHPGRALSTQRIITMVWGAQQPAYADNLVHKYVSGLRRVLGSLPAHRRVRIESGRNGYTLISDTDQVDLSLFHSRVDNARALRGRGERARAAEMFAEALGLWRGPFLGELSGIAFEEERDFMETVRLTVLEEYADVSIATGRHHRVVTPLKEALHRYPLEENLAGLLITALYRSGRTAEAIRVYQRLSSRLLGELNMPPRPELSDLHRAIRRHEPIPSVPA